MKIALRVMAENISISVMAHFKENYENIKKYF